jgi:short-subunit dehydrogenase
MRRVIVVGASSGIGQALACQFAARGDAVGVMARRETQLTELCGRLGPASRSRVCDVSQVDAAIVSFRSLIAEMGGVDLVVLSAGIGHLNPELAWEPERETIYVNSVGFAALAGEAFSHFLRQKSGHLVGITSIASLTASDIAPAYSASKAFAANYLAGLRKKARRCGRPIYVTDIQPGFVDTPMAKGPGLFWVASPEKVATQILRAIERKTAVAYVTRRWRLIAWFLRMLPEFVHRRM